VQSSYSIKYHLRTNLTLSKQQIIDCTQHTVKDGKNLNYFNYGCSGGSIFNTLLYILNNGNKLIILINKIFINYIL